MFYFCIAGSYREVICKCIADCQFCSATDIDLFAYKLDDFEMYSFPTHFEIGKNPVWTVRWNLFVEHVRTWKSLALWNPKKIQFYWNFCWNYVFISIFEKHVYCNMRPIKEKLLKWCGEYFWHFMNATCFKKLFVFGGQFFFWWNKNFLWTVLTNKFPSYDVVQP